MGMLDKFPKLIENMKEVVSRGGFGTSVTPVSQFYAQQSFLNAISEHPWEKANPGYAKMILGYFGKTPCEPDPELVKWAEEKTGLQPTTEKVVDINDKDPEKGLKAAEERLKAAGLPVTDENLFIAAACKDGNADKGIDFLLGKGHVAVNKGQKATKGNYANGATVTVNGKDYAVKIEGDKATVNGKTYDVSIVEGMKEVAASSASNGAGTEVKSPLPGAILKVIAREGDMVEEGDVLFLMEAMKMETEIKAPCAGKVGSIRVDVGATVTAGQLLVTLG